MLRGKHWIDVEENMGPTQNKDLNQYLKTLTDNG